MTSLADRIRAKSLPLHRARCGDEFTAGACRGCQLEDIANEVEELHGEARAAYNRAIYFARALRERHDTHQHHDGSGCDPEKWATCRADRWLAGMGEG